MYVPLYDYLYSSRSLTELTQWIFKLPNHFKASYFQSAGQLHSIFKLWFGGIYSNYILWKAECRQTFVPFCIVWGRRALWLAYRQPARSYQWKYTSVIESNVTQNYKSFTGTDLKPCWLAPFYDFAEYYYLQSLFFGSWPFEILLLFWTEQRLTIRICELPTFKFWLSILGIQPTTKASISAMSKQPTQLCPPLQPMQYYSTETQKWS